MTTDVLAELEARNPGGMAPEEWRSRVRLAACYRVLAHLPYGDPS